MKKSFFVNIIIVICFALMSCKKSKYLDASPNDSFIVPNKISDYQKILDNPSQMNESNPLFGESASDDYYLLNDDYNGLNPSLKDLYTWNDELWTFHFGDWDFPYSTIFYANIALDGLDKIKQTPDSSYNNVKGSALFYRSWSFYQLAQIFAPQYNSTTASSDPGIPLKLKSDINEKISRGTVQQTYDQIIQDLMIAKDMLPTKAAYNTRPSKTAAYGLLARTYLVMQKYDSAYKYADACIQLQNTLLDYNNLNPNNVFPFDFYPSDNPEVIFNCSIHQLGSDLLNVIVPKADSTLFNSYNNNDLRKSKFYYDLGGIYTFVGSYFSLTQILFTGIATDEIYLIRAECSARLGNISAAMADLNGLMKMRWNKSVSYPIITATSASDALGKILAERRKELVYRGTRWSDLRRLNQEGANITVKRVVNGTTYTLSPNAKQYTFLIPPFVMTYHPDWAQNPR